MRCSPFEKSRTAGAQALRATSWFALFASLVTAASCADEGPLAFEDTSAQGSAAASNGAGGRGSGRAGEGGSSGASGAAALAGGSAGADEGDAGNGGDREPGAAPGESGIFVGMTAAHNRARAALDVAQPLEDLVWSEELATVAQDWSDNLASRCGTLEHRQPNVYGENIAMRASSRLIEPFAPEEAVAGWVAEEACWTFGTIQGSEACNAQCVADLNSSGCGHYTQVVWRGTESVGCGYSTCEARGATYEIWVCNYDPPGNFIGRAPY